MTGKTNLIPAINMTRCKACGVCIAFCPQKVFEADFFGRPLVKRPEDCSSCMMCEYRCPDFAITLMENNTACC